MVDIVKFKTLPIKKTVMVCGNKDDKWLIDRWCCLLQIQDNNVLLLENTDKSINDDRIIDTNLKINKLKILYCDAIFVVSSNDYIDELIKSTQDCIKIINAKDFDYMLKILPPFMNRTIAVPINIFLMEQCTNEQILESLLKQLNDEHMDSDLVAIETIKKEIPEATRFYGRLFERYIKRKNK